MNLEIEKFYKAEDSAKNTFTGYFRNHKVKDLNDLKRIYDVHEQDMPYFVPANSGIDIKVPENGNVFEGTIGNTELLAKDVSQACYLSLSNNAEVLSKGDDNYPLSMSMTNLTSYLQKYNHTDKTHPLAGYHCIKGGFESLIAELLAKLNQMPQVTLLKNSMVVGVDEDRTGFYVSTENGKPRSIIGKSMVLACNARGIELISWNGPHFRNTQFQRLFSNLEKVIAVKVYLTYQTAWWEDYGLFSGSIETDLPIKEITAFGQRGKVNGFATLLAAFTYLNVEIFEGLNQASYPRFKPVVGDVPQELLPSQVFGRLCPEATASCLW
ncbi:IL4I1 [Bugula neritina]|uniref:IL4I1 n=1 Tax=Bugula neritina TaxID=10212 RepID=A0A7J7KTH6_BUGNE|nr:IL4I1 [Bugula neritina]